MAITPKPPAVANMDNIMQSLKEICHYLEKMTKTGLAHPELTQEQMQNLTDLTHVGKTVTVKEENNGTTTVDLYKSRLSYTDPKKPGSIIWEKIGVTQHG